MWCPKYLRLNVTWVSIICNKMRSLFHDLTSSIVTYPDLLSLAMGRLTTWRLTPPDLIRLNTEMASLWLRPVSVCPFTERISSPSLSLPSSAACPSPSTVLTKIPKFPLAESRPPIIEKPRDFLPGPFSKLTVKNVWLAAVPLCFLSSVQ